LIEYTPEASRQVDDLIQHYEDRQRPEAIRALLTAMDEVEGEIERNPSAGLRAPRPYPQLRQTGRAWMKAGRYWFAYSTTEPPVIVAVFFDTANIPGRL
jgi:plasmid stabilization system protein ParE